MPLSVHAIAAPQVRALADGTSATAVLDMLRAGQRSKCLIMLALVARVATEARHPEAPAAVAGWRLLERVQRRAPWAVEDLLRHPAVGAWATDCVLAFESRSRPGMSPGWLALVASAAAIRGDVPCVVELPPSACAGAVHLPSLGSVTVPGQLRGDSVMLRHSPGGTELAGQRVRVALPRRLDDDAPGWRALPQVTAGAGRSRLRLVIDDADPYRLAGYSAPLEGLSAGTREEWRRRLSSGWHVLARDHQRTAVEVASLISAVVPLSDTSGAMSSVTTRHAFGSIGLSLPGDDVSMALTLAHEVQHAKLAALMDLLPMVTEPAPDLFYAPWRPDPRPLAGLLQGMYAHLGVARFWRRHREVTPDPAEALHAHVEFARWRIACAQVVNVISTRPELTRCGYVFVDGMAHVLHGWRQDYVPPEAQARADHAVRVHRGQWA
jgi:HEXXH motif-containing protein